MDKKTTSEELRAFRDEDVDRGVGDVKNVVNNNCVLAPIAKHDFYMYSTTSYSDERSMLKCFSIVKPGEKRRLVRYEQIAIVADTFAREVNNLTMIHQQRYAGKNGTLTHPSVSVV